MSPSLQYVCIHNLTLVWFGTQIYNDKNVTFQNKKILALFADSVTFVSLADHWNAENTEQIQQFGSVGYQIHIDYFNTGLEIFVVKC